MYVCMWYVFVSMHVLYMSVLHINTCVCDMYVCIYVYMYLVFLTTLQIVYISTRGHGD